MNGHDGQSEVATGSINAMLPIELVECIILDGALLPFAAIVSRVCTLWRQLVQNRQGDVGCRLSVALLDRAAFRGYIDLIDWLLDAGCLMSPSACAAAARGGAMDALYHLRGRGCPWDSNTTLNAVGANRVDMLERLVADGCPIDVNALAGALANDAFDAAAWIKKLDLPIEPHTQRSARSWESLLWFHNNERPLSSGAFGAVVRWGTDADLDRLVREFGCRPTEEAYILAARHKRYDAIRWLNACVPPCPCNAFTMQCVIKDSGPDAVRLMRERNPPCPWDHWAFDAAVERWDADSVVWLRDAGCPFGVSTLHKAAQAKRWDTVVALYKHTRMRIDANIVDLAVADVAHPMLVYMHSIGAMCTARQLTMLPMDIVKDLLAASDSIDPSLCIEAASAGRMDIVEWTLAHGGVPDRTVLVRHLLTGNRKGVRALIEAGYVTCSPVVNGFLDTCSDAHGDTDSDAVMRFVAGLIGSQLFP